METLCGSCAFPVLRQTHSSSSPPWHDVQFSTLTWSHPKSVFSSFLKQKPCLKLSGRRYQRLRKLTGVSESSSSDSGSAREEWLLKLPDKKKPLYSHSLPCIEAWFTSMGFYQSKDDRAVWFIEKPDWHAQLSMDIRDLHIKYLKSGPGNLERDIERKFSYALSREDLENAILGGP
eukprot:TRINITY_DN33127_c0_g1_i1.p1 TRINITY_DN33127_c0_g1~~TRINITY_DN33127_c0_g1_i1.p1  ORF type:complete len:176 (-),score=22.03 TRINITY_DN33127_c0_g1_i1:306-833(-)